MFQNKLKIIALSLTLVLAWQPAHALFVVTPSAGYKTQNIKLTDNTDIDTDMKMSSPSYGLSLGVISMSGVGFEIAGNYTAGKNKITTLGTEQEIDYTQTTAAAQLSVGTGMFKIYLGYIFMNEISLKSDIPNNSSKMKGPGYQAGITLYLIRALSLSAQYEIYQYNQINRESVGSYEDIKLQYKKVDAQATTVSLAYSF